MESRKQWSNIWVWARDNVSYIAGREPYTICRLCPDQSSEHRVSACQICQSSCCTSTTVSRLVLLLPSPRRKADWCKKCGSLCIVRDDHMDWISGHQQQVKPISLLEEKHGDSRRCWVQGFCTSGFHGEPLLPKLHALAYQPKLPISLYIAKNSSSLTAQATHWPFWEFDSSNESSEKRILHDWSNHLAGHTLSKLLEVGTELCCQLSIGLQSCL